MYVDVILHEKDGSMNSLYDFLEKTNTDTYDTVDPDCDFILIAAYVPEKKANTEYEKFCVNIEKKVAVGANEDGMVIAHWTDFIKAHLGIFRAFAKQVWHINPFDEDFISECLTKIHNMMSGNENEKIYSAMNKLLNVCEQ